MCQPTTPFTQVKPQSANQAERGVHSSHIVTSNRQHFEHRYFFPLLRAYTNIYPRATRKKENASWEIEKRKRLPSTTVKMPRKVKTSAAAEKQELLERNITNIE